MPLTDRAPPSAPPIAEARAFFAHALAMELEAARRYGEFEAHFRDRGEDVLAGLCGNLSRMERAHARELSKRCRRVPLPRIDATQYAWFSSSAPETAAREAVYRIANPRQLLEVALAAEYRALAFFEWVVLTTPEAKVLDLAREMAAEESRHIAWIRDAIEYRGATPDWEQLIAQGAGPGMLSGA